MKKTRKIPLNQQDPRAVGGIDIRYLPDDYEATPSLVSDHRDDYYILLVLTKGSADILCDMLPLHLEAPGLLLLRPFQVHSFVGQSPDAAGWFLSIAPFLVPDHCQDIFQQPATYVQYAPVSETQLAGLVDTAALLYRTFAEKHLYKTAIVKGLFDALVNRAAVYFLAAGQGRSKEKSQAFLLTDRFRQLLSHHSFLDPPAAFAKKLNITPAHLNDSVKTVTGFSVTHWLQDAMVQEAKRHLYYTRQNTKEIAYELGFEDPAYFSRMFKKITGETPLAFRKRFRE